VQTGSQAMADEIVEHFGVERARVKVIPPGVHQSPVEPRPRGGRPYLLGLGTTEPRKDFPLLVRAFDLLGGGHPDLDLRIVGPAGWAEKAVQDAIAASPYRHRIHRLGWVPDPSALMAGAEVFVYPSIYEGFGFPPLEAMVEGVPVVATAAGAVPEVAGPAALLVDPGDAPGLAGAIERVLDDGSLRSELVRAGRDRAREFSWGRTAEALLAVYRELLERSPGRRGR
jgi:glycosyltransferase involved in cell wall biosynthesis